MVQLTPHGQKKHRECELFPQHLSAWRMNQDCNVAPSCAEFEDVITVELRVTAVLGDSCQTIEVFGQRLVAADYGSVAEAHTNACLWLAATAPDDSKERSAEELKRTPTADHERLAVHTKERIAPAAAALSLAEVSGSMEPIRYEDLDVFAEFDAIRALARQDGPWITVDTNLSPPKVLVTYNRCD